MKKSYGIFLAAAILAIGIFVSVPVLAYDVIITDGAPGTSTNGSFVNHVWTPTDNSILVYADLLAELGSSDVEIITNGPGNITVNALFDYNLAVNRHLTLSAAGNIAIYGITYSAGAGSLSVTTYGSDFRCSSGGLITNGGNVILSHSGHIAITMIGLQTGGGSFFSSGMDFAITGNGLTTSGGNVSLNQTGNISIRHGGVQTGGGDFSIHNTAGATFIDGGVSTNGGNIMVESNGWIGIAPGTTFRSGDTNNGGNISLRGGAGITIASVISTAPGVGGVLSLQGNTAAITLSETPVLGAGNITLLVGALSQPIPTLSEWGMILLSFVLFAAAYKAIRQKRSFEKGSKMQVV